jgi:MGT family glycosyltransferase
MPRIVFFSFPAHGHIHPTLPVMRELVRRGDEVFYFSTESFRPVIEKTGAMFRAYTPRVAMPNHGPGPFAQVSTTLETLLDFSRAILDDHLDQVCAMQPTHMMYDSFAPWGSLIAQLLRLPSIASIPSILINAEIDGRYGRGQADDPRLTREWYAAFEARCQALPTTPTPAQLLQSYGDLNIVYTSRLFQPMAEAFDEPRFQFVGPCFDAPANAPTQTVGRPLVLISQGTIYGDPDFFRRCSEELAGTPWNIVFLDGRRSQVSQIELLQRCSGFVTHGGMNSVQEALYYGVPMVLAPQAADQFWISARVVELGAGVFLTTVREDIERILSDSKYATAARRIGETLRAAGGPRRAADAIQNFISNSANKPILASDSSIPTVRPGVRYASRTI